MPSFAACATRKAGSGFGVTGGGSPTTTRVRARSVNALVSESPEPEIGPGRTSTGSSPARCAGRSRSVACSADQTWLAAGRMFVKPGGWPSIVFTAWRNCLVHDRTDLPSVMSMLANVTWQRLEEKSTGMARVTERRRQLASHSRCEESEIQGVAHRLAETARDARPHDDLRAEGLLGPPDPLERVVDGGHGVDAAAEDVERDRIASHAVLHPELLRRIELESVRLRQTLGTCDSSWRQQTGQRADARIGMTIGESSGGGGGSAGGLWNGRGDGEEGYEHGLGVSRSRGLAAFDLLHRLLAVAPQ